MAERQGKSSGDTLTRAELAHAVHRKMGLPVSETSCLINDFFARVAHSLAKGEEVKLASFGTFFVKTRAPRPARNPKTNRPAIVPERKVVLFRPSADLRRRVAERAAPATEQQQHG